MKRITLVKIKKIHSNAVISKYSKEGDAGMDIVVTGVVSEDDFQITYSTGLCMEIPKGYVGLIYPRSSIRNKELTLSNSVGVIDSGYRGEILATFNKTNGFNSKRYGVNDRMCQIIIMPYPIIELVEVQELTKTQRQDGGFGSTGK